MKINFTAWEEIKMAWSHRPKEITIGLAELIAIIVIVAFPAAIIITALRGTGILH